MNRLRAFTPLWALALACSSPPDECDLDVRQSAIKFATPDAGVAPAVAAASVVAVYWEQADRHQDALFACTATRIAQATYLTARHCVADDDAVVLRFGDESRSSACAGAVRRVVRVTRVMLHPELDLALLVSDETTSSDDELAAAMVIGRAQPPPGQLLYIAGYGLTEHGSLEELRALEVTVTGVQASQVEVQGIGGGACVGDSGGPLYSLEGEHVTLRGVLSTGSASCLGADQYVNVADARDWIHDAIRTRQR